MSPRASVDLPSKNFGGKFRFRGSELLVRKDPYQPRPLPLVGRRVGFRLGYVWGACAARYSHRHGPPRWCTWPRHNIPGWGAAAPIAIIPRLVVGCWRLSAFSRATSLISALSGPNVTSRSMRVPQTRTASSEPAKQSATGRCRSCLFFQPCLIEPRTRTRLVCSALRAAIPR